MREQHTFSLDSVVRGRIAKSGVESRDFCFDWKRDTLGRKAAALIGIPGNRARATKLKRAVNLIECDEALKYLRAPTPARWYWNIPNGDLVHVPSSFRTCPHPNLSPITLRPLTFDLTSHRLALFHSNHSENNFPDKLVVSLPRNDSLAHSGSSKGWTRFFDENWKFGY